MIDQLTIGEKSSYDDYGASLSAREIGMPKKKTIKQTVPYSNATYDFSAINGELYWEERELKYVFEMTAQTPEELEEMKAAFADWVMNVMNEKIFDPFIPDYHFEGTFDDITFADEEDIEKTTVTVKFTAYPYKIANYAKEYTFTIDPISRAFTIVNTAGHRIIPKIVATKDFGIKTNKNGVITRYSLNAGETYDDRFMLEKGENDIEMYCMEQAFCDVTFSYFEEVL